MLNIYQYLVLVFNHSTINDGSSYNEDAITIAKSISYCILVAGGKDDNAMLTDSSIADDNDGLVEYPVANDCGRLS